MSNPSPPPPKIGGGPATLDMLDKRQDWLEDVAILERDMGHATRLVLFNLFGELARSGVIDGHRLIANLQATLPRLENEAERLALDCIIADLLEQLPVPASAGSAEESMH